MRRRPPLRKQVSVGGGGGRGGGKGGGGAGGGEKKGLKRGRFSGGGGKPLSRGRAKEVDSSKTWQDEEIESSEEEDDDAGKSKRKSRRKKVRSGGDDEEDEEEEDEDEDEDEEDEEEKESAEQKRRRLAKEYLESMQNQGDEEDEGEEADEEEEEEEEERERGRRQNSSSSSSSRGVTSERLRIGRLEEQGKYFRNLALSCSSMNVSEPPLGILKGHDLSITCLALTSDETTVYSGSKDNSLVQWDVETYTRKMEMLPKWGKTSSEGASKGEVLAVVTSSDGRYVVSGGRDNMVRVFDTRVGLSEVRALSGHRNAVTSLCFRRDSYSLFSGSTDNCIKHWDLNEMGYLETLFGHQDAVNAMDCWTKEKPISASSDRTWRSWKVADESHLVFRGHKSSIDAIQYLTEDNFMTGGQDGSLCVWKETQKKPVVSAQAAHGMEGPNSPRWICSLASIKMSDLSASGSYDGFVRLWKVQAETKQLKQVAAVPVPGFVNALAITPNLLIAGTGREHRLGRWWNLNGDKNRIIVRRLAAQLENGEEEDEVEDEEGEEEDEEEDEEEEEEDEEP